MFAHLHGSGSKRQSVDGHQANTRHKESQYSRGDRIPRRQFNITHLAHAQTVGDAEAIFPPVEEEREDDAQGNDPGKNDEYDNDRSPHLPRILTGVSDEHKAIYVDHK